MYVCECLYLSASGVPTTLFHSFNSIQCISTVSDAVLGTGYQGILLLGSMQSSLGDAATDSTCSGLVNYIL